MPWKISGALFLTLSENYSMVNPGKILLFFCLLSQFVAGQTSTDVIDGNNQFGFKLYQQFVKNDQTQNLFYSPYSIYQSLAMTYNGAQSQTKTEFQQILHFPENANLLNNDFGQLYKNLQSNLDSVSLITANSLWAQKGYTFNPDYFKLVNEKYEAPIYYVNFKKSSPRKKAIGQINNWVLQNTGQQIKELIGENDLTDETRLVLVNAIWFYGSWATGFNPDKTNKDFFYAPSGKQAAEFMHQKGKYLYYTDDLISAISIPYKGYKQSFIILLPNKINGITSLENNFDNYYVDNILKDMVSNTINIVIPKFTSEFSVNLKEVLMKMGLQEAFSDQADFSLMSPMNELKIDKVIHKAKIEINEKGTKAAASTGVVMVRKSAMIHETEFKADHPFIYLIRDNSTGMLLFIGKMGSVN